VLLMREGREQLLCLCRSNSPVEIPPGLGEVAPMAALEIGGEEAAQTPFEIYR
jgi:hypothetical protein